MDIFLNLGTTTVLQVTSSDIQSFKGYRVGCLPVGIPGRTSDDRDGTLRSSLQYIQPQVQRCDKAMNFIILNSFSSSLQSKRTIIR
jgi:hypothetical protein